MPKVSVIIPVYNRVKLVGRAIESVLAQTYRDFEIVVVNDGSTDGTADILRHFGGKIRLVSQENLGVSAARNRGIKEASGEYIAFLDSDDFWAPEKLAEQVKVLDNNPKIGIVYAKMPILNEKGERIGTKPSNPSGKNFRELLEIWGDLPTSTVMTRRECFEKAGLFDTELPTMEDIDMWLRIARTYGIHEIENQELAYYCRHGAQVTTNKIKVYDGLVRVYRKILHNFEDAPKELLKKRIAENRYMLGRSYYDKALYRGALVHVAAVIYGDPLAGRLFFAGTDSVAQRFIKILKPYGLLAVCSLKSLFSKT